MSAWQTKKPCKECGKLGHSAFSCPFKARKPLQTKTQLKAKKPMKKIGNVTKKWLAVRQEWLKNNPPDHLGNYECHYCGIAVRYEEVTLDHYLSRGRHPELRYVLSNLVPCCAPCNTDKSSLDGDEYKAKLAASKGQVRSM